MCTFAVMNTKFNNIVLNVPHSSIEGYSEGWLGKVHLFPIVKRWTDWHTDVLFSSPNAVMVRYGKSRFFCDVERLQNDPLEKVGQGIYYTKFEGFTREFTQSLYDSVMHDYFEHRRALSECIKSDNTLLIDCHSFPSDLSDIDICIGFNDDGSKPSDDVIDFICSTFKDNGFSVGVNTPYANSITPHSDFDYKSIMIEVNKKVYLDETTLLLKPICFDKLKHLLNDMYLSLLGK